MNSFCKKGAGKLARFWLLTIPTFVSVFGAKSLQAQVSVYIEDVTLKTQIEEMPSDSSGVMVYPNPAINDVHVHNTGVVPLAELQIHAASTGAMLFQTPVEGSQTHVLALPAGWYLFRVRTQANTWFSEMVRILPAF